MTPPSGRPGLLFAIAVTNVNQAPTVAPAAFWVFENSPNGSAVGTVPASDPDAGVAGHDVDPDGLALAVTAFDATSVLGAGVAVAPGGGFTYDPRPSAALQALHVGESLDDTFSYAVTDAGLVLSKEALVGGTVAVGTSFAFRLTALNEGPGGAGGPTGVAVEDPLPPLLAFVSSDCASHGGGVVTWLVGTLAAGAEASCELTVRGVGSGPATNAATVAADDTDPEVDPATASATVQLGLLQEIPALSPAGPALLTLALAAIALAAIRRRAR